MVGNMLKLPFIDRTFDGIWSNASLVHFETTNEVRAALSEFSRVLKDSGILHILVKSQIDTKTKVVSDKLTNHDRFFQFFTLSELEKLLSETGFKVIKIKEYNEIESMPHGRPDIKLIWCLAQKR